MITERKEELMDLFKDVDEKHRKLIERTVEEVVYMEDTMAYLKTLPPIRVNNKDPSKQQLTPAGKLYKDMAAQYMAAVRTLLSVIGKAESDEYDPVKEFMEKMRNGGMEVR